MSAYSYARVERLYFHSYLTYHIFRRSKCLGDKLEGLVSSFLLSRYEGLDPGRALGIVKDLFKISHILHDVGKAARIYQDRVFTEPYTELSFKYHEVISALVVYEYVKKYLKESLLGVNDLGDLINILSYSTAFAVLMHHEALRNYVNVLKRLRSDVIKFLSRVNGFIDDELMLIDKLLGIEKVSLLDVIRDEKLMDGSKLGNRFSVFTNIVTDIMGKDRTAFEYLTTVMTSSLQLCDRLAAHLGREVRPEVKLKKLEREFLRNCFNIKELKELTEEGLRTLNTLLSKS